MKETLKNLIKAFIGESQARNRYDFYAKVAKNEGFEQIAEIFLLTAENERVHAKRIFEHIQELKESDEVTMEAEASLVYGSTIDNLRSAIMGENNEYSKMYPDFAEKAEEEGFHEIANRLRAIAKAEEHHEARYKGLLKEVEQNTVFKKEEEVEWICRECGYSHKGQEPPEKCPSCDHSRSYYQLRCEKY